MARFLSALLFSSRPPGNPWSEVLLAVARAFAGLGLALGHGLAKLPPSEKFVQRVGAMGFPQAELFAWLSTLAEFACGMLLAAGLLTRPAALVVAINMAVAGFVAHAPDPFSVRERALLYLAIALVYLAIGGGRFAIDARLRGR